jgi:hypothetical protein
MLSQQVLSNFVQILKFVVKSLFFCCETVIRHLECKFCQALPAQISISHETAQQIKAPGDEADHYICIIVPRAFLTRGQPSATRGSGRIHIKLASDWPRRNIWFIVNMNKNTQALHEALVFALEKIGRKDIIKVERTPVRSS